MGFSDFGGMFGGIGGIIGTPVISDGEWLGKPTPFKPKPIIPKLPPVLDVGFEPWNMPGYKDPVANLGKIIDSGKVEAMKPTSPWGNPWVIGGVVVAAWVLFRKR